MLPEQVTAMSLRDEKTGCLLWQYRTWKEHECSAHGFRYPEIAVGGVNDRVSRWVLYVTTGERGEVARHVCDRTCCVRKDHLLWGTAADNIADMLSRGRHASRRGTLILPDNTGDNHWTHRFPEKIKRGSDNAKYGKSFPQAAREKNGAYTHPEQRPRGENHGLSKLTTAEVLEMRELYAAGVSMYRLAEDFEVSKRTAQLVVKRITWTHI